MAQSIFHERITVSTRSEVLSMNAEIVRYETYIEIRLVDYANIFSLYVSTISQPEYLVYKKEQEITVEYDRFISELVKLFHHLSMNKISGVFEDGELQFIEQGDFRNFCVLRLNFQKPDKDQYQKYVSEMIRRLESDNVKLYKETKVLREKTRDGDRALNDRIKSLELECGEYKRKIELLSKELVGIEEKYKRDQEEYRVAADRNFRLEEDNRRLNKDVREYQSKNSPFLKEQLEESKSRVSELQKDVQTANELIRQLRDENGELKAYKRHNEGIESERATLNKSYKEKHEDLVQRNKIVEERYQSMKDSIKELKAKINELSAKNKELSERLDSAQNVYSHFYNKKLGNENYKEDDVDFPEFTLHPDTNL